MKLPYYGKRLFAPSRYKVVYGGRGSAKSETVGRVLLSRGMQEPRKILCAREFQNSIRDSVHSTLKDIIYSDGLDNHYRVLANGIEGINGTQFIFKGLQSYNSIKSIPNITDLWIEEAQTMSEDSFRIVIPTIRKQGSEIYFTLNPENEDDVIYREFIAHEKRKNVLRLNANWKDNPFFPEVLKEEMEYLYSVNPDLADHVWGGQLRKNSDSQVFAGKYFMQSFDEQHLGMCYSGADWGFSNDPMAYVRCYVQGDTLYIRYAKHGQRIELPNIAAWMEMFPDVKKNRIRGDSARGDIISMLANLGFNIIGAKKGSGSVEQGVDFIKGFKRIIIHPDAIDALSEFKNYSYVVDKRTGECSRDLIDAFNHIIDALRYALEPFIFKKEVGEFDDSWNEKNSAFAENRTDW